VLPEERDLIAAVILNRLEAGMPLQVDPTVQYQIASNRRDGVWWPQITVSDYNESTEGAGPYNTYRNVGLPPGPIVSPRLASIRAVIYPADRDFLFFQASCDADGSHEFFTTAAEHDAYYQLRLRGCQE
jgi:UPF0755 protein